jgi:hypothetical protein
MDASRLKLKHYRFSGRAGEHQAAGDVQAMLAELGDNYDSYHDQVADELERVGGRPDPGDFRGDPDGYGAAVDHSVDLVRAEQILRVAHGWRKDGQPLGRSATGGVPLFDERHRLVAITGDGSKRAVRRGESKAAGWSPPKPPRVMDLGDK